MQYIHEKKHLSSLFSQDIYKVFRLNPKDGERDGGAEAGQG